MHNKRCVVCNQIISDNRIKNKKNSLYCSTKCIKVQWRLSNKEADILYKRKHQLGQRYGITWEDVLQKHQQQDGCCAICRIPIPLLEDKCKAYVDHNHQTGQVRDLLCQHCNSVIGFSKENSTILRLAAEYIDRHAKADEDILVIIRGEK